MGLAVSSAHAPTMADASGRLSSEELIKIYRLMYLSRRIDDREILPQEAAKDLFPDFGCRPRSAAGGGSAGPQARVRLVLSRITATAHSAWRWV